MAPKDGEKLTLNAVLWREAGAQVVAWHCYCGQYGEFVLTGDRAAKLTDAAELTKGMVMVQGIFHKGNGAPPETHDTLGTLELTGDIQSIGIFPLIGTLQKHKLPDGDVWTVSGQYAGDDYVLVGPKVKELDAAPDMENRQIFVMGKYARLQEKEKMPRFGHGYITLETYSFPLPRQRRRPRRRSSALYSALSSMTTCMPCATG